MKKISLALAFVLLSSCVSSGTHKREMDELEAKVAAEQSAAAEKQQRIDNLEKNLSASEKNLMTAAKDKGALKASLEDMQKAMEEMRARQAEQKKRLQEFSDLTRRFKKLTDAGTLSVKIVDGKMVVSLGSDVLFPAGSARLSKEGLQAVKEVANQLRSIPDRHCHFPVELGAGLGSRSHGRKNDDGSRNARPASERRELRRLQPRAAK
jgi:chemotaxis protein MotB